MAALVWETGGKPVPAEAVRDDHVMHPLDYLLSYAGRHLVTLEVHLKDSVRTPLATCGGDGLHPRSQEEVSGHP